METNLTHVSKCKTLAIMGGTFDPIHYGHLVTAEAVRDEFLIERVLFIPTGRPPHKNARIVTADEHRYLMTEFATVGNPYFYTSRIEIDRPGETYTIDTIAALRGICREDATFYFITGADAIGEILTWKNAEKLLELCHFVAVTRPGYNKDKLLSDMILINSQFESRLHFLEVPALAISSTDIRNRVSMNKSIKYLLPESVETYILKHNLYKRRHIEPDNGQLTELVRTRLSCKRYTHTMNVADEAVKLALRYKFPGEKAALAAILHDCAKEKSDAESLELCRLYGIECDAAIMARPNLAHGLLGAEIAKWEFGVEDEDVLNAVRFHTTGRAGMSLLEKIVLLADMIEPGRTKMEYFGTLKPLAYDDIDDALFLALRYKVEDCSKRGIPIHPRGAEALAYYAR